MLRVLRSDPPQPRSSRGFVDFLILIQTCYKKVLADGRCNWGSAPMTPVSESISCAVVCDAGSVHVRDWPVARTIAGGLMMPSV